jgi:MYXO-CTERM domain-containing protein
VDAGRADAGQEDDAGQAGQADDAGCSDVASSSALPCKPPGEITSSACGCRIGEQPSSGSAGFVGLAVAGLLSTRRRIKRRTRRMIP